MAKKEKVGHPDNLIEGRSYQIEFREEGIERRVRGRFLGFMRSRQSGLLLGIEHLEDENKAIFVKWKEITRIKHLKSIPDKQIFKDE